MWKTYSAVMRKCVWCWVELAMFSVYLSLATDEFELIISCCDSGDTVVCQPCCTQLSSTYNRHKRFNTII